MQLHRNLGLKFGGLLKSSDEDAPTELEVAPAMVALALTAVGKHLRPQFPVSPVLVASFQVESVLADYNLGLSQPSEFNHVGAAAFREHMVQLTEFRHKLATRYHRVMHEMFKFAS